MNTNLIEFKAEIADRVNDRSTDQTFTFLSLSPPSNIHTYRIGKVMFGRQGGNKMRMKKRKGKC